jgi:hypothetical protein
MVKCDSSPQRTCFHCSMFPLLQSYDGELYTTPGYACHCAWWSEACVWLLSHGNPFHEAPDKKLLGWRCFQRQLGTHWWVLQPRRRFYALLTSVSLCGLPLRGWAVVAPRRYNSTYSTITALTVDWGSSNRADIWWNDLLERLHAITVPHWKSLSTEHWVLN